MPNDILNILYYDVPRKDVITQRIVNRYSEEGLTKEIAKLEEDLWQLVVTGRLPLGDFETVLAHRTTFLKATYAFDKFKKDNERHIGPNAKLIKSARDFPEPGWMTLFFQYQPINPGTSLLRTVRRKIL